MTDTAPSTIDYYHRRKNQLMRNILDRNLPDHIDDDTTPFCQVCRQDKDDAEELHIDHPNGDAGRDRTDGGWQSLYIYEQDFEDDRALWVVCSVCHYLVHLTRGDGHADRVRRGRPWLKKWEDADAAKELEKRRNGELCPPITYDTTDEDAVRDDDPGRDIRMRVMDTISDYGRVDRDVIRDALADDPRNDWTRDDVDDAIQLLKRGGDLYEPQKDELARL